MTVYLPYPLTESTLFRK